MGRNELNILANNTKDFIPNLKIKSFKIKAKSKFTFSDVKFMSAEEKLKIYKNFCSMLSNHFKQTSFKKNIYTHSTCHYGFTAHYNIHGFYAEYFDTASIFHKIANDISPKANESGCCSAYKHGYKGKDSIKAKEAFYAIYEELMMYVDKRNYRGIGGYIGEVYHSAHYGANIDYKDLTDAIKDAVDDYIAQWFTEIDVAKSKVVVKPVSLLDFI